MPLTHVCMWDSKIGYRRITIDEACIMYPRRGVSARSGHFVCELCAQNVLLTAPGENARHFRHDPKSPNKECDERQASFDPTYGRAMQGLNSHEMPLRIFVAGTTFSLKLGFFRSTDNNIYCDRIKIAGDSHRIFEYSFERVEQSGTTYLNVGSVPSRFYEIEYVNANAELTKFWSNKIAGISATGSFFDGRTGQIVRAGGKAYSENFYYLLKRSPLCSQYSDIESAEIARIQANTFTTWYLYRVRIKRFSACSAQFFLKYAIFLTEKPTKFYPIWPAYINDPYFIYHNSPEFYFYLCGDDAELKSYPARANVMSSHDGKLYKLCAREREQLISLGKSGALGFSYLIRQPINKSARLPTVMIFDYAGNLLTEDKYSKIPKAKFITVSCRYDGKAVVQRKGKIEHIYKLLAEQNLEIGSLAFDTEIHFYQGCDCVRTLCFGQEKDTYDALTSDDELIKKLKACSDPIIPVAHSAGALADKFAAYPKTKRWIYKMMRQGKMSRKAYLLLRSSANSMR